MSGDDKKAKKEKKGAKGAPEAETEAGGEGEEGAPKKKKTAGKTLILLIALPVLLLGGGGVAAFILLGSKPKPAAEAGAHGGKDEKKDDHKKEKKGGDKKDEKKSGKEGGKEGGKDAAAAEEIREGDGVFYYSLPDILVNIGGVDGKSAYLKLKLTIEAKTEGPLEAIKPDLPRVLDLFQAFLRELRIEDLNGSAGSYRLRLELLRRLNLTIAPQQADAVLIEEMLVQ